MPDDKLSAALDAIRERNNALRAAEERNGWSSSRINAEDVPRLLAALDAVQELAADWKQEAAVLDDKADLPVQAIAQSSLLLIRAQGCEDHSRALTEAISRALLGEDST